MAIEKTVNSAMTALMDHSMYSIPPALTNFSFLDTHESVYIYAIFRVEPMPNISFGVGRFGEECSVVLLSDST